MNRGWPAGATLNIQARGDADVQFAYRQCQLPASQEPPIFHTVSDGEAPLLLLDEVLLQRARWELIKIDIDGYDVDLLMRALHLVRAGRVEVDAAIIECNNCNAEHACGRLIALAHELG